MESSTPKPQAEEVDTSANFLVSFIFFLFPAAAAC